MSLKCSIFGCDYGETEIEREREENGDEVVVTIRETETCSRCGDVHLVSENKEVTTMETAADIVADDLDEEPGTGTESESTATADEQPAPETPPTTEGAEAVIPDAETESVVTATGQADDEPDEMPPVDGQDDAVILDDNDDEEDDEAVETEPAAPAGRRDRDPGAWPDEPEDDDDWEQPTDVGTSIDQEPEITSTGTAITVPEGEFYCPECGYATPVESSSLREGDYCPECHRGSLRHEAE